MDEDIVDISKLSSNKKKKIRKWIDNVSENNNKSNKNKVLFILAIITIFFIGFMGFIINFITNDVKKPVKNVEKVDVVEDVDYYKLNSSYNNVFLGDSITHAYDLKKYYPNINTVNSGVNGDNADMILDDMYERVYKYNPTKVFLLVGTNDIRDEHTDEHIVESIEKIVKGIKENNSETKVYVISVYPVNREKDTYDKINMVSVGDRTNKRIKKLNTLIKKMCTKNKIDYINMYDKLTDEDGNLNIDYTLEGLHLTEDAYVKITDVLTEYLEDAEKEILKEGD